MARLKGANPEGASPTRLAAQVADTHAWVESNSTRHVCAFVNVCHALDLDPDAVRKRLYAGD